MFAGLQTHPWAYPVLETVHIFGIALLLGNLVLLEARVFGRGATLPVEALARLALGVALTGFGIAAGSGLLMFGWQGLSPRATVPTRQDRRWEIELAPLTRLEAWKMAPIQPGAVIGILGYMFKDERGSPILRAEYVYVGGPARTPALAQDNACSARAVISSTVPRPSMRRTLGAFCGSALDQLA